MTDAGVFEMAGVCFSLEAPGLPFEDALKRDWRPFASKAPARWHIEVMRGGYPDPAPPEPGTLPTVDVTPEGFEVHGPDFEARFDAERHTLRLVQGPARFPVETMVKMLLSHALAEQGGVLVHGVAVATSTRAATFVGHSGAGKSTLGRTCAQAGLARLADELVALTPTSEGYRCSGTPWNVGAPGALPLACLGRLAWAATSSVERCPPADLLRLLIPNALLVDGTAEGRARQFRILSDLVFRVPTVELKFAPEPGVAATLGTLLA